MQDNPAIAQIFLHKLANGRLTEMEDSAAIEEPLEIHVNYSNTTGEMQKNVAVVMRTPGHDNELAVGFLFTEGVIRPGASVKKIAGFPGDKNRILITLEEGERINLKNTERNFYAASGCGICGKASIDAIWQSLPPVNPGGDFSVHAEIIYSLQQTAKNVQTAFARTGGVHASALFSMSGKLISLREDVGRHNALDKIIGKALLSGNLPLNRCILFLSGRASFELIQKAAMAGINMIAAVGAPSTLAIEMANEAAITLVGFLRNDCFNIYCGKQKIIF